MCLCVFVTEAVLQQNITTETVVVLLIAGHCFAQPQYFIKFTPKHLAETFVLLAKILFVCFQLIYLLVFCMYVIKIDCLFVFNFHIVCLI